MHRSKTAAGATAVRNRPQEPSGSGHKEYRGRASANNGGRPGPLHVTAHAGLVPGPAEPKTAAGSDPGPGAKSQMSDLAQLMEEPAGGPNHGQRLSTNPEHEGRHIPLDANAWQAAEFMRGGGWAVVHAKDGARAGVHAHRGAVHPEEHVDLEALLALVEAELGFTLEEVRSVLSTGGRIPDHLRGLRGRIDARLLALSCSGANMALLGRVLGVAYDPTIKRALRRARSQEGATA